MTKWAKFSRLFVVTLAIAIVPLVVFAAGGKSTYLDGALLNHVFRSTAYSAPATVQIGLFSTCPAAGGGSGVELSGNGYTRQSYSNGTSAWTAPSGTGTVSITNSNVITFPQVVTTNWTVNCFGVWDSTGTNLLYWGPVTGAPVTVSVGATASFASNQLTLSES